jgi:alpha-N-arabinofuranosidase
VGNELYMKDDLSGGHLSGDAYARKFSEYADAMRAVDPSIKLGAIGGLNYGAYSFIADPGWTETLLKRDADKIDFLAVHDAYAPVVIGVGRVDPARVYAAMLAAPVNIAKNLDDVSALLARYDRPNHRIAIAVTEWGPFFHVAPDNPWVDHVKTMGSALFTASTLNVFLRNPRVEIANFFKLADQGFMGWMGRRDGAWIPTASADVFALYSHGFTGELVDVQTRGPSFGTTGLGVVGAIPDAPTLDAVASIDGSTLTLIVTNKGARALDTRLAFKGVRKYRKIDIDRVRADALDANSGTELPKIPGLHWAKQVSMGHFENGAPDQIHHEQASLPGGGNVLQYSFPAYSVTRIVIVGIQR